MALVSICDSALSASGKNFSGLLACAPSTVISSRLSRLVMARASSTAMVPAVASRSMAPTSSAVSTGDLDGVMLGRPRPRNSACSTDWSPAGFGAAGPTPTGDGAAGGGIAAGAGAADGHTPCGGAGVDRYAGAGGAD